MAEVTSAVSVATLKQLGEFAGKTELGGTSLQRSDTGDYHLTVADFVGSKIRQTSFTLNPRGQVISSGSECPATECRAVHQLPGLSPSLPFTPQEVIQAIVNARESLKESASLETPRLSFDRAIMANRATLEFELVDRADMAARLEQGFEVVTSNTDFIKHFEAHRSKIESLLNTMQSANEDIDTVGEQHGGFNGDVDDYLEDSHALSRQFGAAQGRFDRAERELKELAPYLTQ